MPWITRAMTAATTVTGIAIATSLGITASHADTQLDLTLKSKFTIGITVRIDTREYEVGATSDKKTGTKGAKGSSIKWVAKPIRDSDKTQFVSCEGTATVTDKGDVVVDKASAKCQTDDHNAAAKSGAGNSQPPAKTTKATFKFVNNTMYRAKYELWDQNSPNGHLNGGIGPNETLSYEVVVDQAGTTDLIIAWNCPKPYGDGEDRGEYHRPPSSAIVIQDLRPKLTKESDIDARDEQDRAQHISHDPKVCQLSTRTIAR